MSNKEYFRSVYDYSANIKSLAKLVVVSHSQHISCVLGIAFMLLTTLVLLLFYKNRVEIWSFIYKRCNSCCNTFDSNHLGEKDKLFDCYLSHSPEDKDVAMTILKEVQKKSPNYTFCIRERNWTPGTYIPTNIFFSVQNSRKTLIVITETFVNSPWFHLEFQVAFHQMMQDKSHRVILVLKDLSDKKQLPTDVQYFLYMRSYLQWGNNWFWEKLRKSLRDVNHGNKDKRDQSNSEYVINYLLEGDASFRQLHKNQMTENIFGSNPTD